MLDADTFRRLVLRHTGLIYVIHRDYGFTGEDLRDAVQDFWARLWASRQTWPEGGPDNEVAFLRRQARCRADDRKRDDHALKRGAEFRALSFEQPSASRAAALRFYRQDDEALDAALIEHAIRVVASTLSTESEAVILARLDDGEAEFSKVTAQRAIRRFRRAIELPSDTPRDVRIEEMGEHVVVAARRIAARAAEHPDDVDLNEEVMTCAADPGAISPATDSRMNDERRRSGAPAPKATATTSSPSASLLDEAPTLPTGRACERRPTLRSPLRPSASARSRRLELSVSPSGTTSPATRRAISRVERTVVTPSPTRFEEDSSVTGGSR